MQSQACFLLQHNIPPRNLFTSGSSVPSEQFIKKTLVSDLLRDFSSFYLSSVMLLPQLFFTFATKITCGSQTFVQLLTLTSVLQFTSYKVSTDLRLNPLGEEGECQIVLPRFSQ